jgi:hypothetical protein
VELKVYLHSIEFVEPSFREAPEVLDAIDMYSMTFGEFIL